MRCTVTRLPSRVCALGDLRAVFQEALQALQGALARVPADDDDAEGGATNSLIDVNSCVQLLTYLFGQLLSGESRTSTPLSLLNQVVKSVRGFFRFQLIHNH